LGRNTLDGNQSHITGCITEHKVAAYFLSQGYSVYWPAVQQDNADLVVLKDGAYKRVQCKTAWWNKASDTPYDYLQCRLRRRDGEYTDIDLMAIVYENTIWVIPVEKLSHTTNVCLTSTNPEYKARTNYDEYKDTL
jgi:hypothetical protein